LKDAGIHAVRRHIKRARAGLRLLRPLLGKAEYRRDNVALRKVSASLREARDAKVMRVEARSLAATAPTRAAWRTFQEELRRDHTLAMQRLTRRPRTAAAGLLQAVSQRLSQSGGGQQRERDAARTGLRRTYERARRAFQAARRDGSVERWHECRKQMKYVSHQLDLLAEAGFAGMAAWRRRAHRLTALLGEDHDLALLRQRMSAFPGAQAIEGIARALDERRGRLQHKALRLGATLLQRGSREFSRRAL
jgi:CHAD domain-containing protein